MLSTTAGSQELPIGKYTGRYDSPYTAGMQIWIVLDIKRAENGMVEGTGARHVFYAKGQRRSMGCAGGFALTGTIKDEALELRSAEKYGFARDCTFRLVGMVSANKIVGRSGGSEVELFK